MARSISVFLLGNSDSLEKAFARSSKAAQSFGTSVEKAQRKTKTTGSESLTATFAKSAAVVSGGVIAWNGLESAIRSTIETAREARVVNAQLDQQLQALGISAKQARGQIEETNLSLSHLSGFNIDELAQSFTTLVRATGDVTQALKLNRIAVDIARGTHRNLQQVVIALGKAYTGQTTALKRLGIAIPATLKGMDAINFAAKRFAGQAESGSTSTEKLGTSVHNLQVTVGEQLLPALDTYIGKLSTAINKTNDFARAAIKPGESASQSAKDVHALGAAFVSAADKTDRAARAAGGWRSVLSNAISTTVPEIGALTTVSLSAGQALRLIGAGAKSAASGLDNITNAFNGAADAAGAFGAAVVGALKRQASIASIRAGRAGTPLTRGQQMQIALAGTPTLADLRAGETFDKQQLAAIERRRKAGIISAQTYVAETVKYRNDLAQLQNQATAITQRQANDAKAAADKQAAIEKAAADKLIEAAKKRAEAAKALAQHLRDLARQRFETQLGWAQFGLEKAETTKRISDDIKADEKIIALLRRRAKQTGMTLDISEQIWRAQQDIRDKRAQALADAHRSVTRTTGIAAAAASTARRAPFVIPQIAAGFAGNALYGPMAAGTAYRRPVAVAASSYTIHTLIVNGVQDVRGLEQELLNRTSARPHPRRGP